MGAGMHGGFGNTSGYSRAVPGDSVLIGKGIGERFGVYASKAVSNPGFTDVIVHGNPDKDTVSYLHNSKWVDLDQRRLANYLKNDLGYNGGPIRLLSCGTGRKTDGFAQNLANKLGVKVKAPSDTIWAFPNGRLVIGPNQYSNTGHWKTFTPKTRKGGK